MILKFWGVRGSLPVPGPETLRYGGNTSCLEIRLGEQTFIIDAGTGIRALGRSLTQRPSSPLHLFLGHYHWDHIQGLPFFDPLYLPGQGINIYGPDLSLGPEEALRQQMISPFFPADLSALSSDLRFLTLPQHGRLKLGDVEVQTQPLNHPGGCLGLRINRGGRSVAYLCDTEHQEDRVDPELLRWIQGSDILIYDAMFTQEELSQCRGWGHSTLEHGLELALAAGIPWLLGSHHAPGHHDEFLDGHLKWVKRQLRGSASGLRVQLAREGMELQL